MLSHNEVIDRYYLDARCELLEIAAMLDRYDRAFAADRSMSDTQNPKLTKIFEMLEILADRNALPDRTKRILALLSQLD